MRKYIFTLIGLFIFIIISGCSNKVLYIDSEHFGIPKKRLEMYRYNKYEYSSNMKLRNKYKSWKQKNINTIFNVYNIECKMAKPYFMSNDSYIDYSLIDVAEKPEESWTRRQGIMDRKDYKDPYTFMMFTLNEEPFNKEMIPYFNTINTSYESKLNPKSINKFVKYDCDKNIVFSKYERDENYQPLKATCYVKRLDKDVFLITRFAHPNTQKDKKLFQTEIIPTMLKSIKVTPTKLSLWKYY